MKFLKLFVLVALYSLRVWGQQFDNPVSVPVTYYGMAVASATSASFSFGTELGAASSGSYTGAAGMNFYSPKTTAYILPGKVYSVNVTSTGCGNVIVYFPNLAGYNVYINGRRTSAFSLGANYQIQVRIEAINDLTQNLAGMRGGACSSFPDDKAIWYIGLGSLRNGRFAGGIGFRASSITSALTNPSSLMYDTVDSSEVSVTRDGNGYITNILSRDVAIIVDPYTGPTQSSYNIKVCQSATPTTPFITYTIKQYPQGSTTGIQIDKVENGETWSTVLQQTASSWTKYDWRKNTGTFDTANPITTSISGSTSTITYGTVDSQDSTKKLTKVKTYSTINGRSELSTSTLGTGLSPALTTTYNYYSTSTGTGWASAVQSKVEASGRWVAYDYYNASNDARDGLIQRVYRPWLDAPSAPGSATTTNCYLETYDYTTNFDGSQSAPASKTITINGVAAGKTTWSYSWSYTTANSHTVAQTIENDYSSSSSSLATTTLAYRPDDSSTAFQGKLHSVTRPDGTKDSYAYYFGTWSASNNTFTPGSGNDRLTLVFHGQAASGTGTTLVSSWTVPSASWNIDPLYLVANLSTVTETVVDTNGHLVLKAENIYTGSAIERISGTAFLYNSNNLVGTEKDIIRSVAVTGGDVSVVYQYQAGLMTQKTDVDGTATQYGYDNYLRNTSIVTALGGSGNYPATTQSFTYYSSNLKQTGQETARATTVTSYRYDTAGRVINSSIPQPGGGTLATAITYPTNLQSLSTFNPTGGTTQVDYYLDGKVKGNSGSAQVDSHFDYSVDTSGNVVKTTRHGADKSNGWVEETFDWLGRTLKSRTPEWGWTTSSQSPVLRKTYNYNSTTGQLSSVNTTDEANSSAKVLPDHIYIYGNLGMLAQDGDDVGNNGQLDTSSRDRIKVYTTYFMKDTSGYNGWLQIQEVQAYRTLNNSTDLATISEKHIRYTRFNNGNLNGSARVLSDVVSLDSSGRYTVDQDYADANARTRTHYHAVQGVSQAAMTYWQDGYLQSEVSASGVSKIYTYDSLGRMSTVTEGTTNASTTTQYASSTDVVSSVTTTIGATNATYPSATTSYSYSWGTGYSTVATTDAALNISYAQSNLLGMPWRTWGAGAQPSQLVYDPYGRRTSITTWQGTGTWSNVSTWPATPPAGKTVTWNLDNATGLANYKQFADGSKVQFTYNARGQMKTRTWARTSVTTYNYYDTLGSQTGELQSISYSDGTQGVSYTYTRAGAIYTVSDQAGTRTLAYGADLKPTSETYDSSFYASKVLTLSYDSMGRSTGYSFNGSSTVGESFGYDATTGRLNSYTGTLGSTSATFTPTYASGTDWVNGVTSGSYSRSMPLVSRNDVISSVTTQWAGSTLGAFTADYTDQRGWRHGQTAATSPWTSNLSFAGALASIYTYDGFGQLTGSAATINGVSASGHSSTWTFDLAGNRATEAGAKTATYTPGDLNQYTAITGTLGEASLGYDPDGNMTNDGTWTYTYDCENRIKGMTGAGQTLSFKYDYLGRRIQKTVTGTNSINGMGPSDTKYLWTGWKIVAELNSNGSTVNRTFVWGPDFSDNHGNAGGAGSLLAQIDGSTVSYAMPDALGNIVGYFSSSSLSAAVEYSPFGRVVTGALAYASFPIGYSGQYTDWETSLVYYGHRFYNPKHGRFINRDPSEEAGGYNLYAFCLNRPIRAWDVLGREILVHDADGYCFGGYSTNGMSAYGIAQVDFIMQTYNQGQGARPFAQLHADAFSSQLAMAQAQRDANIVADMQARQDAVIAQNFQNVIGTVNNLANLALFAADVTSMAIDLMGKLTTPAGVDGVGGGRPVVVIVDNNGNQSMPITYVKNQAQANQLGVPVGTMSPIFVPPGENPQGTVDGYRGDVFPHPLDFFNAWKPGGPNDFKLINPIFDAYGNFMYGAAGTAEGFSDNHLRAVGDLVHGGSNNDINTHDIQSGIDFANSGNKIIVVPVPYP